MCKLVIAFIATTVFFSYPVGDADIGWHLKYGEIFLQTGKVVRDNFFSWTFPDYHWTNHSWGFDPIAALLFNGSNFWLLSLSAGAIIALSLLIILPTISIGSLTSLAIFWFFGSELLNTGLRSQLFSFLFTSILWRFLTTRKHLRLLPLLFLFWANLHGQFIYGLGILALYLLPLLIGKKKQAEYIFIGISSLLITLINPFGMGLWDTAISHLNAPELKYIYEWAPWDFTTPKMIILVIYIAIFWWLNYRKKISSQLLLPLAATTLLALTSRRSIPYFLILSLSITASEIDVWIKKHFHQKTINSLLLFGLTTLLIIGISRWKVRSPFIQSWDTYCNSNVLCSEGATKYMQENQLQGKLWNAYRLGGYLIYRLPQLKPMIDGRMTIWHDDQGTSPFLDYTTMVYLRPGAKQLFFTMNPDFVLIQPQYPLAQTLLSTEKWPVLYSDDQVILFSNPQHQ